MEHAWGPGSQRRILRGHAVRITDLVAIYRYPGTDDWYIRCNAEGTVSGRMTQEEASAEARAHECGGQHGD